VLQDNVPLIGQSGQVVAPGPFLEYPHINGKSIQLLFGKGNAECFETLFKEF
jgi:hypothetical protein